MNLTHLIALAFLPLVAACAGAALPAGSAPGEPVDPAIAAARNQAPLTMPFDPRSHEVAVQGSAGGSAATFLIDTAVDPSALDHALASAHGLSPLGEAEAVEGVGSNAATAYPATLDRLAIGGREYGPLDVAVMDMSKLSERYGAPLAGILGYSLLKDHAVLIDYPARLITLFDGAAQEPRQCAAAYRFPLQFLSPEDRLIIVPGFSLGGVELPAFIDTGSSNGLRIDVNEPAVAPLLSSLPEGQQGSAVGARGEASQRTASLDMSVSLGDLSLRDPDVAMVRGASMAVGIGNRFFEALGAALLVDIPGGSVAIFQDCRSSPSDRARASPQ